MTIWLSSKDNFSEFLITFQWHWIKTFLFGKDFASTYGSIEEMVHLKIEMTAGNEPIPSKRKLYLNQKKSKQSKKNN